MSDKPLYHLVFDEDRFLNVGEAKIRRIQEGFMAAVKDGRPIISDQAIEVRRIDVSPT